ncbi:L-asparaginase [Marinospirillum celere]|uniref:L-asparaginase n=1 Tax=Marinospirillum celere TaxID=1122252 RepID=A0A1I1EX26_9GAMM|nr:asparaginase [Marinospirillum celere]SFB91644.1 L-asparaginase [Marinospirillum celere]
MKIAVINTGGTLSCVGDPLAPMSAKDFAQACEKHLDPLLRQKFADIQVSYLTGVPFSASKNQTLDSTDLQPTAWCLMAQALLTHYADFDGFVLLQGTDTLDFTGGALPFLLAGFDSTGEITAALTKPVVITGSMLPMFYQEEGKGELALNFNTDAFQNLCGALAAASLGIPEVSVYFHHHLYRSSRVVKTHTSDVNAFSSPNYPPLAKYAADWSLYTEGWLPAPLRASTSLDDPKQRAEQLKRVTQLHADLDLFPVMLLNAFPAPYSASQGKALLADLVDAMVQAGARGIVLQSYGAGNFPSGNPDAPTEGAVYQAFLRARAQGVYLVNSTRVPAGAVKMETYAAGAWLRLAGVISVGDMTPMTAMAKLMILMALAKQQAWTPEEVERLMQTSLCGELG